MALCRGVVGERQVALLVLVLEHLVVFGDSAVRELSGAQAVQDFELGVAQHDVLLVQLVADGAPPGVAVGAGEEGLDFVRLLLFHHALHVLVVAHVVLVVVPFPGHLADAGLDLGEDKYDIEMI